MGLSRFHDYLLNTVTAVQMDSLVGDTKVKSHKRLNYIFKNPEDSTLEEILFFAELLNKSPYDMYRLFRLGGETLGPRTTTLLMAHHNKIEYSEEPVMAE